MIVPGYGEIKQIFEVCCAECGVPEHPNPSRSKSDAGKKLIEWGWSINSDGKWICKRCTHKNSQ